MSKIIPLSLRKHYNLVRNNISEVHILDIADSVVTDGMNYDTLIGIVVRQLLNLREVNNYNDKSFGFKKNLMMYVFETLDGKFDTTSETKTYFDKNGNVATQNIVKISHDRQPEEYHKQWFREITEPQTCIVLKGSNKMVDNNSSDHLNMVAEQNLRVKTVNPTLVYIYSAIKYEENKNNVSESRQEYKDRLNAVAEETILYMGYEFSYTKKLDSSTRGYHLSRFGFANPYGDAFEKNLIEPASDYKVTDYGIWEAKQYLCREFKVKSWRKLYERANRAIEQCISSIDDYTAGLKVDFPIDSKTLGKYMHITEVVNEIIYNPNGMTSCLISVDFTNSGVIQYANHFGDEKLMKIANLLGGDKMDSHSEVAKYNNVTRNEAKKLFVGSNHGGRVPENMQDCKDAVFGSRYDVIRQVAEYGIKCAFSGIQSIELIAPDGLKGIWTPHAKNCKVNMEDNNNTTIHGIMPFTTGLDAQMKVSGFGVIFAHMGDAFVERYIYKSMLDEGIQIKTILDAFYIPAGTSKLVQKFAWEALEELDGWFREQMIQVEKQTGIKSGLTNIKREHDLVISPNIF